MYLPYPRGGFILKNEGFTPKVHFRASLTREHPEGFTIMELLVTITVLLILLSMTFAAYTRFQQQQALITVGQNVKNLLRDAQSRAYTGEVDCSVCSCSTTGATLSGWFVDFLNREIYGMCGTTTFSHKPFGIDPEIMIIPYSSAPEGVLFRSFPPGVSEPVTLCIRDIDHDDAYYKITVSPSGSISESGKVDPSCAP